MFNFTSSQKKKIAVATILTGLLFSSTVTPASAAIPFAPYIIKGAEIVGTAVVSKVAEKVLNIVCDPADTSEKITNIDSISKANRTMVNSAMQKHQAGEYPVAANLWTIAIDNIEKQGVSVPKEYYKNRATTYSAMGETNKAIGDLNRAIAIDPKYAKAYNDRAVLYAQIGDNAAAQRDFERAARIDPNDEDLPYNMAILHVNVGREQQRINSLEDVHSFKNLTKISSSSISPSIYPLITKINRNQGSGKTASAESSKSKAIAPKSTASVSSANSSGISIKPISKAPKSSQTNLSSNTENEYKIAIDNLTASIKLNPKNANAYRLRGLLYQELKEEKKARKDFAKAKKLDPSLPIPDKTK